MLSSSNHPKLVIRDSPHFLLHLRSFESWRDRVQNSLGSFSASSFRQFGLWLEASIATGNDRKKSHEQAPESGVPRRANRVWPVRSGNNSSSNG